MGFFEDRKACVRQVMKDEPFCLVLAFPCGPWSPLTRLRASASLAERRRQGRILLNFALILARIQMKRGAHFIVENPRGSLAWSLEELVQFLELPDVLLDRCSFGLRSEAGFLHKKPARIVASSTCVADELRGMVCAKDHFHQPVIGGSKISGRAGHYPVALAKAIVKGLERQFHEDFGKCREVLAVDGAEEEPSDAEEDSVMNPIHSILNLRFRQMEMSQPQKLASLPPLSWQ